MEDNLNGKIPILKMTSMKATLIEDNVNGRQPQWMTISNEDNLNNTEKSLTGR